VSLEREMKSHSSVLIYFFAEDLCFLLWKFFNPNEFLCFHARIGLCGVALEGIGTQKKGFVWRFTFQAFVALRLGLMMTKQAFHFILKIVPIELSILDNITISWYPHTVNNLKLK
jgi:hypothetical protein